VDEEVNSSLFQAPKLHAVTFLADRRLLTIALMLQCCVRLTVAVVCL